MSRNFEAVLGLVLNVANTFGSMRPSLSYGECTAKYKARQRDRVFATVLFLIAMALWALFGNAFNPVSAILKSAPALEESHSGLVVLVLASTAALAVCATYPYWALRRFIQPESAEQPISWRSGRAHGAPLIEGFCYFGVRPSVGRGTRSDRSRTKKSQS